MRFVYGNSLDELSDGVDVPTTSAVEQVRVAVLKLKGIVGEASILAAQLALARRRRLLGVDRHRRRQLPQLPTVLRPPDGDLGHSPTSVVGSATPSEFTSTESSSLESCPTVDEVISGTSMVSDLTAVACRRNPVDLPGATDAQSELRLAQVYGSETDTRLHASDVEPNQPDGRQRLLTETTGNLEVENCHCSGVTGDCERATVAYRTVTHNHALTTVPNYRQAISYLLHTAGERKRFRRLSDSVHNVCRIVASLNHEKNRSVTPWCRCTTSHIVAVVSIPVILLCFVLFFYYEESCESSCGRTNGSPGRSWLATLTNLELQLRHIAPRC